MGESGTVSAANGATEKLWQMPTFLTQMAQPKSLCVSDLEGRYLAGRGYHHQDAHRAGNFGKIIFVSFDLASRNFQESRKLFLRKV
jgi:hypothetical protein